MAPQLVEMISQTNLKEWDWRVRCALVKDALPEEGMCGLLADASRCRCA
jgi:hypothetical protein